MLKRSTIVGMGACAFILLGFAACGNKASDAAVTDSLTPDSAIVDTQAVEDTAVTLDSALAEAVDSIKDGAQPGDDGYVTTPSGLKYKVLRKGTGATPNAKSIVKVNYEGKLASDGIVFDSSYQKGEPIDFAVGGVIPGWTEGLQLMQEGAEYEFYIPSNLGYGESGTPRGEIPPNADLIFKVELLQVK